MRPSGDQVAPHERYGSHGHIALQHQHRVLLVLCEVEELLAQRVSSRQLCPVGMEPIKAPEGLEALRRLSHLVTQRVRAGIDLPHCWSPLSLHPHQKVPQDEQQPEFVLGTLAAVRQGRQ
jgi:hypothetical protein